MAAQKEEAPSICGEYLHEGIWYPNVVLESSIEALRSFEVRDDDVWMITFPKSGTHWIIEIVGQILKDGHSEQVDRSLFSSTVEMINMSQTFPMSKEEERDHPMDMSPFLDVVRKASSPRTMMTHMRLGRLPPDLVKKAKVVYLARNPKDVTTSWYNFIEQSRFNLNKWEDNLQDFLEGRMHWGPWPDHVKEYWNLRNEDNFLFVFYEDLLKEPERTIGAIATHIGHPLSVEALHRVVRNCQLSDMKAFYKKLEDSGQKSLVIASGEHRFLNKGKCGQWKDRFTVAQNEMFNNWYDENMRGVDMKVTFE